MVTDAERVVAVLVQSEDDEQIIERVAALDIGKAEIVCCVRLPAPDGGKRRVQEVTTHSTMVRRCVSWRTGWSGSVSSGS